MNGKGKYLELSIMTVALTFFVFYYKDFFKSIFSNCTFLVMGVVTVILVNMIKLMRIYIILFDRELSRKEICFIYMKTAIVNSIFPYKIGEIYRMYVVGKALRNMQGGIIITLLDRLMDTLGLLIVIFLNVFLANGKILSYSVVSVLIVFVFCIVSIYFIFPEQSAFWKKFLLKRRSSKRKLWGIEFISRLQFLYKDIAKIVNGRGIMLIITSVMAWCIEIGSISLISRISMKPVAETYVSEYLNSILSGKILIDNARYTILSVILLCTACIIYLFLYNNQWGEKR